MISTMLLATVLSAKLAGSGCQAQETKARLEGDTLVVEMPAFEAAAGGPKARGMARAHCEAVVTISAEAGKQLAGKALSFTVDVEVGSGASGEVTAKLHQQGQPETSSGSLRYADGAKRNAQNESVQLEPRFGGCGKDTTLVFGLAAVAKGTPAASAKVGIVKGSSLALAWKACK